MGRPPKDVAENLGVSIPTLYRWVPSTKDSKLENDTNPL
jgi:hypothetical protein